MKSYMKVLRWDPKRAGKPRHQTYVVPFSTGDKVLGGLLYIYKHLDPCLSFRFNCRGRHCGECAVMINGMPRLSCAAPMSHHLTLEPLRNLPVVKDLIIDRSQVYRSIVERLPVVDAKGYHGKGPGTVPMDVLDQIVRLDDCIQCLCCMAVCPIYKKEPDRFLGPFGLLALATAAQQGAVPDGCEQAAACTSCGLCEKVCPRNIPIFSEAIQGLKERI